MFQNIGFTELLLIAVVALVLFGPQKLPEIGRILGRTLRDFKKGAHALLNDEPQAPAAQATDAQATAEKTTPEQPAAAKATADKSTPEQPAAAKATADKSTPEQPAAAKATADKSTHEQLADAPTYAAKPLVPANSTLPSAVEFVSAGVGGSVTSVDAESVGKVGTAELSATSNEANTAAAEVLVAAHQGVPAAKSKAAVKFVTSSGEVYLEATAAADAAASTFSAATDRATPVVSVSKPAASADMSAASAGQTRRLPD
ncbi:twin-arginine translocase TatA/TatE family subunit [Paenibacillus sp. N3.4]|uniref:twin-arginine translocase TatA/TatE family subunit n=1 Tax=Paenibacillus sp. N3.4 TaxID=2603222 RepID=UPI0011CA241C|nr:twin-arginine translocase TatA/TatE family subunit [Paenibacillus sp. N3.4]TXK76046.1 twin-arginine translocase TatA/TatE family subunit [Paenibacillus sp. N3.4]